MKPDLQISYQPSILRDITQWVDAVQGINLGQGVCQTPVPELILGAMQSAILAGHNRYAPPLGVMELRSEVANKLSTFNRIPTTTEQVAITHGSTGAWEAICQAWLCPGDEVILFRPFYPYHRKAIEARGAKVKVVDLWAPNWTYDSETLKNAFGERTKLVVVCTPNNPTGKIFSRQELLEIGQLCQQHGAYLVSDEVYEYMTYDGVEHVSPASIAAISEQVLTMGSFSKTYSITGWRVGYLRAPAEMMPALGTLLDRTYVCSPTPAQHAVLAGLRNLPEQYYRDLAVTYAHKKDLIQGILTGFGFECLPVQGAYYLLASPPLSWSQGLSSVELIEKLVARTGVGAVPAFEFLDVPGAKSRTESWLRFCYSQPTERLEQVKERLGRWESNWGFPAASLRGRFWRGHFYLQFWLSGPMLD